MKVSTKLLLLFSSLCYFSIVHGQSNFWTDVTEASIQSGAQKRMIVPQKARNLALNLAQLKNFLARAPLENTIAAANRKPILSIPMPGGGFQNFAMVESPMMEPGLAAAVPGIKTYSGQGIEDPSAIIKIDVTSYGFHAMTLSPVEGSIFIDPYSRGSDLTYISYYRKDFKSDKRLVEKAYRGASGQITRAAMAAPPPVCVGSTLRTYRLAVACTGEYAAAVGAATKEQALAAIVTTVNRVNGIYERELAIRLTLVANNLKIVFAQAGTDPFIGNDDGEVLIEESQKVITDSIGTANFDIGHTFSTGAGGLAGLGVVCNAAGKASGVTGSAAPAGDAYDVDYVAHEFGHQFGASHTFNAVTGSCEDNGDLGTNVEPGSGSTIMAYAGICGSNDLQVNSDPYFHSISLRQIRAYVDNPANTCGVITSTGNQPPVVNAGPNYTIPKSTPFILTGSATDPNGDALTYSWEQLDIGGNFGDASSPTGQAPIFRSFIPVSTGQRVFPRLSTIVSNSSVIGELLPSYGRTLDLSLTARDNKAGGGGVCADDIRLTIADNSGPFIVTEPNIPTSWDAGSYKTITWTVAGTNTAPVNAANVAIHLSTDGGFTYPITILASTPNDGSEEIVVPNNLTTQARIRVMAVGNIFFDISNTNFTIQNASSPEFVFNNPAPGISCSGANSQITVKTSALGGFNSPISLSASGNPAGTTLSFSSTPVNPGTDVVVTLQGNAPAGTYIVSLNGVSGSISKSVNLTFVIGPPSTTATLNTPANNTTGQSEVPNFTWSGVVGAASYTLQISTNSNFSSIVQTISGITSTSHTLTSALNQNAEYYWRIIGANGCGLGTPSSPNFFRTWGCSTVTSTDVPKIIAAENANSITSNLFVTNGVVISDINVIGLKGTHGYISDLGVYLESPAGTIITLFDNICEAAENFDLNFDDEASLSTIPCPPTGGVTVKPFDPLAAFKGQSSLGKWILTIEDYVDDDGGSLTGWGLRICSNVSTPLPVNWLSFTGQKAANNTVQLQWSTANETRNSKYEIERSADGILYAGIGSIAGGNNPTMLQQYYFTDLKPFGGVNYYRLKQIDIDGKFTYSAVIKIALEAAKQLWTVYPNPAHDQSVVRVLSDMSKVNIILTDGSGKQVYRRSMPVAKAGEQIVLPLSNLAKGIYLLKVESASESRTEKIMVR